MLGSCLLITSNDAITKWIAADYPVSQMLCARGSSILLLILPVLIWKKGRFGLQIHHRGAHLMRGLLSVTSATLFITGLQFLPLVDAVTLTFAGPLFLTAMAPYLLAEQIGWRRWVAVLVGFFGVVLMLKPGTEALRLVALLPLGAALMEAFRDVLTRRMSSTESSIAMVTVTTAVIVAVSLLSAPFGWTVMAWGDLALLALAGALFAAAHFLVIEALRYAQAAVVIPFRYSAVIWALLLGLVLWGDVPDYWTMVGTVLVISSGIYIWHRETLRTRGQL